MRTFLLLLALCFGCSTVVSPHDADAERRLDSASDEAADLGAVPDGDAPAPPDAPPDVEISRCEQRPSRVVKLFPGYPVQFALTERGCVWVWGRGGVTRLFGRSDTSAADLPELIPIQGRFRSVHREFSSICAIRIDDETAWCWSRDGVVPIRYPLPVRQVVVPSSLNGRCVRLADRSVWCTGRLGAIPDEFVVPRRIDELGLVDDLRACWSGPASFRDDEGLRVWFAPDPAFVLPRPPDAAADTCFHSDGVVCYITRAGSVQCVGSSNSNLVLGDADANAEARLREIADLTRVTEVSGDVLRMAALRDDGTIWTWGRIEIRPTRPQLVLTHIPVRVGTIDDAVHMALWRDTMLFVRRDGSVWKHSVDGDGPATNPQLRRVPLFGEP